MKLQVLGCSGSIGQGLRTTALLLDDAVLLDAGTGVGDLTVEQLCALRAVFITHAHLDHVACLPMLADLRTMRRAPTLAVHALPGTVRALRQHLFNGEIWPDFTRIPDAQSPALRFAELEVGDAVALGALRIEALPAAHTVPALGYRASRGGASLVFTGDTGPNPPLWQALAARDADVLIVDTAFGDDEAALAATSLHHHPAQLAESLRQYRGRAQVFITHAKPGEAEQVAAQLRAHLPGRRIAMLREGQVLELGDQYLAQ